MLEFVEIQLAKTNPKLSKMGQSSRIVNSINRFAGGRIIDKSFFLRTAIEGASLSSGSSLFHSDKQFG